MTRDAKKQNRERRHEIMDLATDLFLENGFAATSMSRVAEAAGITKASLYHHFPGKEDLFAACVAHGYTAAIERLRGIATDQTLPHTERMARVISSSYDTIIFSRVGRMSPLIAEVSRSFPKVARGFHRDFILPQENIVLSLIDDGVEAGAFVDLDRAVFEHLLFGPIVTLSMSREMFATFDDLDTLYPVTELRDGHIKRMIAWLTDGLPHSE
ncbi:TetR/AcrR family transcriptional regulator [Rhodovulum sulfidophilum]|uniref:TetR/AcrR family transcriptional regulator n=1 Tax=Rhodovulum sulfidophilum TaxID=35806 RepID=UPI001926C09B|nr:TetR/AcrR family transcriptional regulator [Rhodovulum sulfidophilum]MBL3587576.1 TetR/AcrR family transcriptional regulator [Rhodovulum sulfidophilum]